MTENQKSPNLYTHHTYPSVFPQEGTGTQGRLLRIYWLHRGQSIALERSAAATGQYVRPGDSVCTEDTAGRAQPKEKRMQKCDGDLGLELPRGPGITGVSS